MDVCDIIFFQKSMRSRFIHGVLTEFLLMTFARLCGSAYDHRADMLGFNRLVNILSLLAMK